ncbi:MAG: septal ring lytic transglycosylase RlpA family protein, partial [Polaromonas sp.]|nr:septal ring lytic transglycosylase RlpA family protein [Polaromonas sp.]
MLAFAFTALSWLAACTSAPQQPPAPVASAALTTLTQQLPANPPVDVLVVILLAESTIETTRSALLAGEPEREYQRGGASWYGP